MLILFLRTSKYIFPYFFLPNNDRSDLHSSPSALSIFWVLLMGGWACHVGRLWHSSSCLLFNNWLTVSLSPNHWKHLNKTLPAPCFDLAHHIHHRNTSLKIDVFLSILPLCSANLLLTPVMVPMPSGTRHEHILTHPSCPRPLPFPHLPFSTFCPFFLRDATSHLVMPPTDNTLL